MSFNDIPDLIILFGGGFAFLLACGQLAIKNRKINNYLLAILLLLITIFQISNSFFLFNRVNNWHMIYNYLFTLGIIAFICISPLQYIYFKAVLQYQIEIPRNLFFHFVPVLFAAIILFSVDIQQNEINTKIIEYREFILKSYMPYKIISIASVLIFLFYSFLIIRYLSAINKQTDFHSRKTIRIVRYFISSLLFMILMYVADFFFSFNLLKTVHVSLTLIIVAIYILSNRYPQFLHITKIEAQRNFYIRSQITGMNIDKIVEKMNYLMNEKKVFLDDELNIKKLSKMVAITPHQLSEILNMKIEKSFNNYINYFRIQEAERLLTSKPDQSILSIAYEVGFNTTSAFYNAFKKFTGESPSEYKKQNPLSPKDTGQ